MYSLPHFHEGQCETEIPAELDGRAFEFVTDTEAPQETGINSLMPQKVRFVDASKTYDVTKQRIPYQAAAKTDEMLKQEYFDTKSFMQKELKRDPRKKPEDLVTKTDHVDVCTSCTNYEGLKGALHGTHVIDITNDRQLFYDDYLVKDWKNIIRFVNQPVSQDVVMRRISNEDGFLADPRCPCSIMETETGFKMYFAALLSKQLTHTNRQVAVTAYSHSKDGLTSWSHPKQIDFKLWDQEKDRTIAIYEFDYLNRSRRIKYVAGYQGDAGQSCVAGSEDGVVFRPLAHKSDVGTFYCNKSYLARAGDTYIVPLYDSKRGRELVWYREDFGTKSGWREIRGMHAAEINRTFEEMDRPKTGIGKSHAKWYLDRLGKLERFRRQVYSLTWTEYTPGFFLGLMTVLEWGKDMEEEIGPNFCAFERDTANIYLVTSRDGVHIDDEWVYAQQPLIPHGVLQKDWNSGFMMSGTQIVSTKDGKWDRVYFEARTTRHEKRMKEEGVIAAATFRKDRLAGLKAANKREASFLVTKTLAVQGVALYFDVDTAAPKSSITIEILTTEGKPIPGYSGKCSIPIEGQDGEVGTRWINPKLAAKCQSPYTSLSHLLQSLKHIKIKVRLFGDAKVYSFRFSSR